jgi:putative flippase GtrA
MTVELARIGRFLGAGIVNTIAGLAAVGITQHLMPSAPYFANLVGFAGGLAVGFFVNRSWTFRDRAAPRHASAQYLAAFAIAYLLNLALLALALRAQLPPLLAQAIALVCYSMCFYTLCRWLIFRQPLR